MKAALFSPGTGFTIRNVDPPNAGTDEAVISVEACGVCGSDKQIVAGESPPPGTQFPVVLGHEMAGRIDSFGSGTNNLAGWKRGQDVLVYPFIPCGQCRLCETGLSQLCVRQKVIGYHRPGGFAQQLAVPVKNLIARPKQLSAAAGALLVDAFATPYHALKQVGLVSGESVLVLGTGGLGLAAMLLARTLAGHSVGMVSRRSEALDAVPSSYAEKRWVSSQGSRQVGREVRRWSNGGVDVVIDTTGSAELIELGLDVLHPGGRMAMVGMKHEELTLSSEKIVRRGISLSASYGSTQRDVEELVQLVEAQRLHPEALIADTLSLDQIGQSFETQINPGRVVIVPQI